MHRRIASLLPALLLFVACDDAKTEARKGEATKPKTVDANKDAAKAAHKADHEKAADEAVDDKTADDKTADDKTADDKTADEPSAEEKAKADEEKKARTAKRFAELETWKTEEKARWNEELEAQVVTLVASEEKDATKLLAAILASSHRLPANTARDEYRNPAETLTFFGIEPSMTVIEIGPGWGWYTEILAPMLASQGKLVVTNYDPAGPEDQGVTIYGRRFEAFAARSEAAYGKIETIIQKDPKDLDLGPDGSADMVFIARGIHGWVNRETFDTNVAKVHAVLNTGGIAAIVQHRAKADAKAEESAKQGYVPEAWVIERFEAAGFSLAGTSEVNANSKDTKDHPEGVWTLPPTLSLGDTDRDKYVGIGESDRMTLRFEKK